MRVLVRKGEHGFKYSLGLDKNFLRILSECCDGKLVKHQDGGIGVIIYRCRICGREDKLALFKSTHKGTFWHPWVPACGMSSEFLCQWIHWYTAGEVDEVIVDK